MSEVFPMTRVSSIAVSYRHLSRRLDAHRREMLSLAPEKTSEHGWPEAFSGRALPSQARYTGSSPVTRTQDVTHWLIRNLRPADREVTGAASTPRMRVK